MTNFSRLCEVGTFVDDYGRYRIKLSGKDVKNHSDIRLTLAPSSRAHFDDYIG